AKRTAVEHRFPPRANFVALGNAKPARVGRKSACPFRPSAVLTPFPVNNSDRISGATPRVQITLWRGRIFAPFCGARPRARVSCFSPAICSVTAPAYRTALRGSAKQKPGGDFPPGSWRTSQSCLKYTRIALHVKLQIEAGHASQGQGRHRRRGR